MNINGNKAKTDKERIMKTILETGYCSHIFVIKAKKLII